MQQFGVMNRGRKQHESYCWTCHRDKTDVMISCTTCVRSFHLSNLCTHAKRTSEIDATKWRCTECIEIEKGAEAFKNKQIDGDQLKTALDYMYKEMINLHKEHVDRFMTAKYPRGMVVNTMDLATIHQKIEIGAYTCPEDFQCDFKWILHNTKVHYPADYDMARSAKILMDYVKEEVYNYKLCHDCYVNRSVEWFTMVCPKPHLILWGKQRTYPYWPSKLMRYNSDNNTIDVIYFGEDHLRAVLPVKDCLLYSRQNPSTSIGLLKESLNEALVETESYIKNVIAKYGQFNYANPLTFVFGNKLDRHLYDTIPGAWKELGEATIPAPIEIVPTTIIARRMSVPAKRTKRALSTVAPTAVEILASGRVITRRCSTIIGESEKPSKTTESSEKSIVSSTVTGKVTESNGKSTKSIESCVKKMTYHSQVERLLKMTVSSTVTKDVESSDTAPIKSALKRKTPETSNGSNAPTFSESSSLTEFDDADSVFKMPIIPKRRKLATQVLPVKDKTVVQSAVNVRSTNGTISPKSVRKTTETRLIESTSTSRKVQLTPEMSALCKTVIEKSTQKMTENVRLSLTETLFDFLNTSKPGEQIKLLQEQLENQRSNFNEIIQNLRIQNHDLKLSLKKMKDKFNSANKLEGKNVIESHMKTAKLTEDLEKSKVQIAELNHCVNTLTMKNTFMTKLHSTNMDLANSLKTVESKNFQLIGANTNLMDTNAKLRDAIDILTAEKKQMADKMKAMELEAELFKQRTYENCAKKITETKQQQWCAGCGLAGGRYFCSPRCELYFR